MWYNDGVAVRPESEGTAMLKKVRVRIVTERTEMEGSLYGGGVRAAATATPERMEMTTVARYRDDGVRVSLSWTETEASGMEGTSTTVSYQKSEPLVVTMMRTGAVNTALVFEQGRRHHCVYKTPIMPFEVCVSTDKVENGVEKDGTLFLDYAVELRGATCERTKMNLSVLPDYDRP